MFVYAKFNKGRKRSEDTMLQTLETKREATS